MISSRSPLFFSLIPLIIITITNIRPTAGQYYSFQHNVCSPEHCIGNKSADVCSGIPYNGTFGENLNHIFSSLLSSINTTTSAGFYSSSYGDIPDKAYAIGYCRGDHKPPACAACLAKSADVILQNACPNTKDGGIGSINCTLRYSNTSISGIRVTAPALSTYSNGDNVSQPLAADFNKRLTTLFETLTSKAAAGSVLKFAVGHSNAPDSSGTTIYGLAQCSPDLSETDCGACFSNALKDLAPCCHESWIYLGASCSLTYEPYLFYDPVTDPTPLPPPSPPPPPRPASANSGAIGSSTSRMVITALLSFYMSLTVSYSLSNDLG